MELNIIEDKKNRMVFELSGVDHTFCNILKEVLREDKDVQLSAYNIQHPLVGIPKFVVETVGSKAPKDAVNNALKKIKATDSKLKTEINKKIK